MPLPNLILIGPPKCGTTSVFNWISLHPEVCVSSEKETYHFFERDEEKGIKEFDQAHFEQYEKYFKGCEKKYKAIVEATPEYLYSESAIHAFSKFDHSPKFLFIYRDPADRMFSDYVFHRYKTKRYKVDFDEYTGFKASKAFSASKINQGYYSQYLSKWVQAFGEDRVIIMHFEDLKNDPSKFMSRLSKEINIDPSFFGKANLESKNKTVKLKSRQLHQFLLKCMKLIPQPLVKKLVPLYYKLNSSSVPQKSERDLMIIENLKDFYESKNATFWQEFKVIRTS